MALLIPFTSLIPMRYVSAVCGAVAVLLLAACGGQPVIQTEPPALKRGVAQGLATTALPFDELKTEGMFIADSRLGTHVIIPADRLFIQTVPRPVMAPDYLTAVNHLVRVLQEYPDIGFAVVGYTNSTLNSAQQARMSTQFAQTLADYLTAAGVAPDRILLVEGKGDRDPIVDAHDATARRLNRRVEVVVYSPLS